MQPEIGDGAENEDTVSCHIKTMQAELKKNAPNMATIEDRMQRTLAVRRAAVKEKLRSEILEEYPALRMDAEVKIMWIIIIDSVLHACLSLFFILFLAS